MLANIPNRQKVTVMIAVMLGLLLAALDQTIVSTAMPKIVEEFNGLEHLSWVFTAYMLASAVTVPIYGKLSDIFGRRLCSMLSIVVFMIGSVLAGFSHNMTELIIFRAIQGIGGGALMANAFTVIGDLFPPAERGKWQGMLGGVFGLSSVIGPTLGGYLTDNVSWRWNFFLNVPVGFLALGFIFFFMPKIVSNIKDRSIDYLGAITLTLGLIPLLLGFVWGGNQYPWISPVIISLFAAAAGFLMLFAVCENTAKEPILPLSLFKNPIFSLSMLIVFLIGMGMFGVILYIPLFAQGVIGVNATNSGTIVTPMVFGLIGASIVSGQIVSRTGRYKWLAVFGLIVITGAMFWLSRMNASTTQLELVIRMIAMGIGLGITMPIFNVAVQNAFDHSKLGVVTASTQLFRSIGATVGVAIMGSVLNSDISKKISDLTKDPSIQSFAALNKNFDLSSLDINKLQGFLSKPSQEAIRSKLYHLPPLIQSQAIHGYQFFLSQLKEILALSIADVFFLGSLFMGVALIASIFIKEIPLRKTQNQEPPLAKAGIELATEEGEAPAASEPEVIFTK